MAGASIGSDIVCDGESNLCNVNAENSKIGGDVFLRDSFKDNGIIDFTGSHIRGDFDCSQGQFSNCGADDSAIKLDASTIGGNVRLCDGFVANGGVSLKGTVVTGNLNCSGGQFFNSDTNDDALCFDGAKINGGVYLSDGFSATGGVTLIGATIGIDLDCTGGNFIQNVANPYAFNSGNAKIERGFLMNKGFHAEGWVSLLGAQIGGDLNCSGGYFVHYDTNAYNLDIDNAKVINDVDLDDGFIAKGMVTLNGATIGGDVTCSGGKFSCYSTNQIALTLNNIKVAGSVILNSDFNCEGNVSLPGASIGEDLDCSDGKFESSGTNIDALNFERAQVGHDVFLRNGFRADGRVCLIGTTIGGDLDCSEGRFVNSDTNASALEAYRVQVGLRRPVKRQF